MQQLLDAGELVSTHGVQGELKLLPWTDSPEFLLDFDRLGTPWSAAGYRRPACF